MYRYHLLCVPAAYFGMQVSLTQFAKELCKSVSAVKFNNLKAHTSIKSIFSRWKPQAGNLKKSFKQLPRWWSEWSVHDPNSPNTTAVAGVRDRRGRGRSFLLHQTDIAGCVLGRMRCEGFPWSGRWWGGKGDILEKLGKNESRGGVVTFFFGFLTEFGGKQHWYG